MKSPSFPFISIPLLSLFLLLPILGLARSGWEPWEVVVLCLLFFGAVSAFMAMSWRFAVAGHGVDEAPARSGPVRVEERVVDGSDSTSHGAGDENCTVWDCF